MTLHTYYEPCIGHDLEAETKLLLLWRDHWTARGHNPVVLNEWHARQHPDYGSYNQAICKLPTVNSPGYERACFLRHLALAQVGGGLMSDYDVFSTRADEFPAVLPDKLNLFQINCVCPCLFYATPAILGRLCQEFAKGELGRRKMGDRDHFSDQYVIVDLVEQKADWIQQSNHLLGYGDDGWSAAQFVHFSNSACRPRGMIPRWKHIPNLLNDD